MSDVHQVRYSVIRRKNARGEEILCMPYGVQDWTQDAGTRSDSQPLFTASATHSLIALAETRLRKSAYPEDQLETGSPEVVPRRVFEDGKDCKLSHQRGKTKRLDAWNGGV